MDRIQIFDQLVPFNQPANKAFSLEALYHHFNFWTFIQSSILSELCLFKQVRTIHYARVETVSNIL